MKKIESDKGFSHKYLCDGIKTEFGVVNRSNQVSSYIHIGIWIIPRDIEFSLRRQLSHLEAYLSKELYNISIESFPYTIIPNRNICIVQGTINNKYVIEYKPLSTFCDIEIALYFNGSININSEEGIKQHKDLINQLVEILKSNKWFEVRGKRVKKDKLVSQ